MFPTSSEKLPHATQYRTAEACGFAGPDRPTCAAMLAASAASYGGMLKVFPWGLGLGSGDVNKINGPPSQAGPFESPSAQAANLTKMKRKRQGSSDSSRSRSPAQPPKKKQELAPRPMELTNPPAVAQTQLHDPPLATLSTSFQIATPLQPYPTLPKVEPPMQNIEHAIPQKSVPNSEKPNVIPKTKRPPTDAQMKETMEMQFGLEILLKHRELRLIDQEIAKCQIALEQLRRCSVVPYPAFTNDPTSILQVASGSGPSYGTGTSHAAPWGVTDGPYSRHYRKFLISDRAFGDQVEDSSLDSPGVRHYPDRESRTSKGLPGSGNGKSRAQRGSMRAAGSLQALPHGYPEAKVEKGPMIVKRASDNKMVKLVCLHCRREDFNSAQGFINHCRIAHQQSFASHEAAAAACGEVMDGMEVTDVKMDASTPTSATANHVHPLIRTSQLLSSANMSKRKRSFIASAPRASRPTVDTKVGPSTPRTPLPSTSVSGNEGPFRPSPQTPYLSTLISKSGRGGDLAELVTEAKAKITLEDEIQGEEDAEMEEIPETPHEYVGHPQMAGSRLPVRSELVNGPFQSSAASKASKDTTRLPRQKPASGSHRSDPSSLLRSAPPCTLLHSHSHDIKPGAMTPLDSDNSSPALNLSPQTTESHPAPSLVSDDGDYENLHSEDEVPSSAHISDEEDLQIHVEDHEHRHGVGDEPGASSTTAEVPIPKEHHRPVSSRRTGLGRRRGTSAGGNEK